MDLVQTLTRLSEVSGPAGQEGRAAALVEALLRPYMDEVSIDTLGNVVGIRRSGTSGAKRVLVEAHLDEVGFVVTGHKGAFLTFAPLGTVDARQLPGARLRVLGDPERVGIVASMPPHLLGKAAMEEAPAIEDMALDLGLSEEEAQAIALGTAVVYDTAPLLIGDGLFSGKALDNRASIAAVLLALDRLCGTGEYRLDCDLIVLFSVQEELGLRGVQTGVFALEPDLAICLDVTFGHQPDAKAEQTVRFGGGAAIGVGPVLCRALARQLQGLAEAADLPYQLEILPGQSSTTADKASLSRAGVPTALISLPVRYMHSAVELVSLADIEAVAGLLAAVLRQGLGEHSSPLRDGGGSHA
ncbi:MAG: M42 family peptidase [Oscillospiraceae bacterium]|nr:M42 family peptidase [Oscillospiraceae bacterium]